MSACSPATTAHASGKAPGIPTVQVRPAVRGAVTGALSRSAELVPFEETDVYAKESGYVTALYSDYGSHVRKGEVIALLDIPELRSELALDDELIRDRLAEVRRAQQESYRVAARHRILHLESQRLAGVAKTKPGLVAPQDLDNAEGNDLAAEAESRAAAAALQAAQSSLEMARAQLRRDQALYAYSRVTAPFDGIVTQRYANLGTLVQKGTQSDAQAMPVVRLAESDVFRLVIPIPETDIRYVRIGDPAEVSAATGGIIAGRVARMSFELADDTRTMHAEVDVANARGRLVPGTYAEATLRFVLKRDVLKVPVQAVTSKQDGTFVYVVNPQRIVEIRPAVIGVQSSQEAEVRYGLLDGELVVVSDRSGLEPGQKVNVEPALEN